MSDEEQLIQHGKIMREYAMQGKRLVALRAKGNSLSTLLMAFNEELQDRSSTSTKVIAVDGNRLKVSYRGNSHLDAEGDWPTLQDVKQTVDEIRECKERIKTLAAELRTLGIPIDGTP